MDMRIADKATHPGDLSAGGRILACPQAGRKNPYHDNLLMLYYPTKGAPRACW